MLVAACSSLWCWISAKYASVALTHALSVRFMEMRSCGKRVRQTKTLCDWQMCLGSVFNLMLAQQAQGAACLSCSWNMPAL